MKAHRLTVAILLLNLIPVSAAPLIARFQSVLGDFDVLLDSTDAPRSTENFTTYANRGAYDRSIIHRSTTYNPGDIQIVQGGGFQLVDGMLSFIPTDPPIALEAGKANVRGTLAMARTAALHSATSQWFFNVADNPALDFNYAVFGRVMGVGQNIIEAIGTIGVYDASPVYGGTFNELPLLAPILSEQSYVVINATRVEPFAISNITRHGTVTELRWSTLSTNTPLRVERTTNIGGGDWTPIASNVIGDVFTDTNAPAGGAFYRLATEP